MTQHNKPPWPKFMILAVIAFSILFVSIAMRYPATSALLLAKFTGAAYLDQRQAPPTGTVPDYFQTTPEILPGISLISWAAGS